MNELHTETCGRFWWAETVADDGTGLLIRTARARLPSGLVVERVTTHEPGGGDPATVVFMSDLAGVELTLTAEQFAELGAASGDLDTGEEMTEQATELGRPLATGLDTSAARRA